MTLVVQVTSSSSIHVFVGVLMGGGILLIGGVLISSRASTKDDPLQNYIDVLFLAGASLGAGVLAALATSKLLG